MRFLNLNLKKRNRKLKSSPVPSHNNDTSPDELNTIGCDFRASLLEDIMRELHTSSPDYQRTSSYQKEEKRSSHSKSPASIFVSPSSKRGSSGGVGPFLSPPSVTPIATPFSPSSPITSSSETNHNKVTCLNPSALQGQAGRHSKLVEEDNSCMSKTSNRNLTSISNAESQANNESRGAKSKEHDLPLLGFDRLLRKELRLIESRMKSYYSVPDLSILRHNWTPQEKHEQAAVNHHHHYHYNIAHNCQSSFYCSNISQSNMYHHQSHESPCHLDSNQTNFEHQPKCSHSPMEHHHYHHHYHSLQVVEEKSKRNLDQSSYCHQHLPFMVNTCVTGVLATNE